MRPLREKQFSSPNRIQKPFIALLMLGPVKKAHELSLNPRSPTKSLWRLVASAKDLRSFSSGGLTGFNL